MIISIFGLLLLVLGLVALILQRFYSSVPAKELKRLAARGDHLALALYRPVAYGASMRVLLWSLFCLGFGTGAFLIMSGLVPWAAFVVIVVGLVSSVLLQSIRLTVRSARFAVAAAPALNWVLGYIHRPFEMIAGAINRFRSQSTHSGLYEKEDLHDLLAQQKEQPDNRISDQDLDLLSRAIQFDERQAADIALPMSRVKLVKVDDHIGPVLLGELHASGQNSFLVYDGLPDHIVGTLFLRDAIHAKEGGRVTDLMHPRICYVHEDFSLHHVLRAFTATGQFMAVVINAFEEPVGVITLQHLLAQLVGEVNEDDTESFEDRASVAAYQPVLVPVLAEEPADSSEELNPESAVDTKT